MALARQERWCPYASSRGLMGFRVATSVVLRSRPPQPLVHAVYRTN